MASAVLKTAPEGFRAGFDRTGFEFEHSLHEHPLLTLESFGERLPELERDGLVTYRGGDAEVGGGWEGLERRAPRVASARDALDQISTAGAWIKIRAAERAEYQDLYRQVVEELSELTGIALAGRITRSNITVFISSPGSVTPYHLDHETNFLFQISGEKTVNLFDASDPSVVSAESLERFYVTGAAAYEPTVQERAHRYRLRPGTAVHHPCCWPHWVRTESEPSISMSINFCLRERDLEARVHQVNHYLRRLGMHPAPPGRSRLSDGWKQAVLLHPTQARSASLDEHLRAPLRRLQAPLRAVGRLRRRPA